MTFDEQLRRAFERLSERLRHETAKHLAEVSDELSAAVEVERAAAAAQAAEAATASAAKELTARLAEVEAPAEQRGREAGRQEGLLAGREEGFAAGREEGLAAGREEGLAASRGEARGALAAGDRVVAAVRAIDRARSLSEILDALADAAGREAARAGVLVVRGGRLRGWRFVGFGSPLDEAPDIECPLDGAGVVADAVRAGAAASIEGFSPEGAPPFADSPLGRDALALPVAIGGQIVAVVYADQGPGTPDGAGATAAWQATLEIMARHAARCLETVTAFRTAKVFADLPAGLGQGTADVRTGPSPRTAEDEEQAARRYARLLISEIKMYHEPTVIAGRQERDLVARLGGEIARARVLYEQRVPADVRRAADYFHAELVRTLADGDASLLEAQA